MEWVRIAGPDIPSSQRNFPAQGEQVLLWTRKGEMALGTLVGFNMTDPIWKANPHLITEVTHWMRIESPRAGIFG
jgi:hypothetical protein